MLQIGHRVAARRLPARRADISRAVRRTARARRARRGRTRVLGGDAERALVAHGRAGPGRARPLHVRPAARRERRALCMRCWSAFRTPELRRTAAARVGPHSLSSWPSSSSAALLIPRRRIHHRRQGSRHVHQRGRADRAARQSDRRDPVVASVPAASRDLFFPSHAAGNYYGLRFMGFFIQDPADGRVIGQFPHFYPASIAIGYGVNGLSGRARRRSARGRSWDSLPSISSARGSSGRVAACAAAACSRSTSSRCGSRDIRTARWRCRR